MSEPGKLRVAALGDLHVTTGADHSFRQLFAEISREADALALCGDLTHLGNPREADLLAEELRACSVPVVAVLGNHDYECGKPEEVVRILEQGGVKFLESQVHEVNGVGFAGVKGFAGGFGSRMLSPFGEPAIKQFANEAVEEALRLEKALHALDGKRIVVVLHYAPILETVAGEPPEIIPFLGSSRLAETIDRFEVAAVCHGHAHHGVYSGRTPKGVPVYNCAQFVPKEGGRRYALIEV